MPMTSRQMLKLLQGNGFVIVSQNGSHVKLRNPKNNRQTILPLHSKSHGKGLEQAILK